MGIIYAYIGPSFYRLLSCLRYPVHFIGKRIFCAEEKFSAVSEKSVAVVKCDTVCSAPYHDKLIISCGCIYCAYRTVCDIGYVQ